MEPSGISISSASPPPSWSPATRLGFRIAFLYFFCFIVVGANGTLLEAFPVVGGWIQDKLNWPLNHLSEFAGQYVFHLSGIAAHWHPSDSGDTAMNWIHDGLALALALAGGILWTVIAHLRKSPRTEYRTLHAWLRFFLRLTCGMFMIGYGLVKVFPFQMPPPSVAILTEPAGNMAPMTFLWNLIGLSPVYEIICGSAEVLGGVLLLYRRTALAGALFSTFVVTNVVLYNYCYDVPVKLFATNLLLGCVFLALPDFLSLCRYFWSHRPAAPTGVWIPPISRRAGCIAILVTEIVFAVAFLVVRPIFMTIGWRHLQVALRTPSPLVGAWHLDDAHAASGAFIDPEGIPVTDLYVAQSGRAYTRSADGELWLTGVDLDQKGHTVRIDCYFINPPTNYAWQLSDPNHLILTSILPNPSKITPENKPAKPAPPIKPAILTLTRTPTPDHYPLLERGFHFISEWRYER
ncbi:hypothetical protein ACFPT7_20365 [Acidicapsa dinghuensis]|uniref:DoxX family protein n=1 Tax=Acidicapsa dinghuensis TaxID=2218256 RepID=A0ABW1EL37_9BACT|nr:hypothetical protein [Acidicapsa dinghuensis]